MSDNLTTHSPPLGYRPAAKCGECGHPSEPEGEPGKSPQSIRRHFPGCREGEARSRLRAELDARSTSREVE